MERLQERSLQFNLTKSDSAAECRKLMCELDAASLHEPTMTDKAFEATLNTFATRGEL